VTVQRAGEGTLVARQRTATRSRCPSGRASTSCATSRRSRRATELRSIRSTRQWTSEQSGPCAPAGAKVKDRAHLGRGTSPVRSYKVEAETPPAAFRLRTTLADHAAPHLRGRYPRSVRSARKSTRRSGSGDRVRRNDGEPYADDWRLRVLALSLRPSPFSCGPSNGRRPRRPPEARRSRTSARAGRRRATRTSSRGGRSRRWPFQVETARTRSGAQAPRRGVEGGALRELRGARSTTRRTAIRRLRRRRTWARCAPRKGTRTRRAADRVDRDASPARAARVGRGALRQAPRDVRRASHQAGQSRLRHGRRSRASGGRGRLRSRGEDRRRVRPLVTKRLGCATSVRLAGPFGHGAPSIASGACPRAARPVAGDVAQRSSGARHASRAQGRATPLLRDVGRGGAGRDLLRGGVLHRHWRQSAKCSSPCRPP